MCATPRLLLTGFTLFLGVCLIWGCSGTHVTHWKPDEADSLFQALVTNGFDTVSVTEDRAQGVITLTGTVESPERKAYAAQIAEENASDYVIANELIVMTPSPTADQLAQDKLKPVLHAPGNLGMQNISYQAKDGTLILSGFVQTTSERAEAVKLAKGVPNVERVVDEIKVRR